MIYIFMTITCNGDDGFQNMFVYQPTFNTLELIKDKRVLTMLLIGKQKEYIILDLHHYMMVFHLT